MSRAIHTFNGYKSTATALANSIKHIFIKSGLLAFFLTSTLATGIIRAEPSELPNLGGGSALITPAQEHQLGSSWLRSLKSQVRTVNDPLIVQYLHDLVYKLAPYSRLTDHRLNTVIVDSNALNAFAVPGGVIGVNAGLFLYANTEQEFASVIAHEIAHLSQRHFARRLEESKNQTAVTLASILASIIIGVAAGSDAGVAAMAGSMGYSMQNQLSYGRLHEQEADRIGMDTLAARGMDVKAMPSMFNRMLRSSRFNREPPEYLRTHPLTESRVADTANRAANYPSGTYTEDIDYFLIKSRVWFRYASNAEEALAYFSSLMQNSNPYQRYFSRYGFVLAAIAVKRPEEAENELRELLKNDANRISVVALNADWLTALGQPGKARELLKKHLNRNPANYPLTRQLATLETRSGNYQETIRLLYSLLPEYEGEPSLWYDIAETNGLLNHIAELHQARAEYFYQTGNPDRALKQLKQALIKVDSNHQQTQIIRNRIKEINEEKKEFDL